MRWLADECVHSDVVEGLRATGEEVLYAAEAARQTADYKLADRALQERRILLTEDKDFGELVFRDAKKSSGIILLRFSTATRRLKWPALQRAIDRYGPELERSYTVITESRVRLRPLENHAK